MLRGRAYVRLAITLAYTSVTLFTTSAYGQSPAKPASPNDDTAATQGSGLSNPEKKVVTEGRRPNDLENEVAAVKAENAAVREHLRKMEEQQKVLLELVDRMQRRLDGLAVADGSRTALSPGPAPGADTPAPSTAAPETSVPSPPIASVQAKLTDDDHYQDGIVIWKNPDDAKVPFLLKFNVNTQIRYLNTLNSADTFTDHLGNVREVNRRNDITVNRAMFILGGYIFSKKLQ
jgi:hypothetical protein